MKNILCVADIHIHAYNLYNYTPESRLNQAYLLADKIIKAGRDHNCEVIAILGDVFEKSVARPHVINTVKEFLDKLMSHFQYGYLIVGNHDADSKSSSQDPKDTTLTALLPKNLFYADEKIVNENGCTIAFSNWKPKFDLSWIQTPVDFFLSHVTINYDGGPYKGQDIDETRFRWGIFGDIHKKAVKGKLVSIGTPQMGKVSDQQESTAVVLHTDTKTWEHIDLDPEEELFRLQYTRVKAEEGFTEDGRIYKIYKPVTIKTDDGRSQIVIPQWDEINSLITGVIEKAGLQELHSQVVSSTHDIDEVDFDFRILKLKLKNFRSISEAEIDFDDNDKVLILGENGNGKSSLLLGLRYALTECRSMKDFIKFDESECTAQVDLLYQKKLFSLKRGTKDWGLAIDGVAQSYNNKRQFEEDVHLKLPFIDYMDIFFFNANQSTIIGSLTPDRKSHIISKFFKLDKIDSYNETAKNLYNQHRTDVEVKIQKYQALEELIKFLTEKLESSESELPSEDINFITSKLSSLKVAYDNYMKYMQNKSELSRLEGMIQSCQQSISTHKEKLSGLNEGELKVQKFNSDQRLDSLSKRNFEYSNRMNERTRIQNELTSIIAEGSSAYQRLTLAKSSECPYCHSKIESDSLNSLVNSLQEEVNRLVEKKSDLESRLVELPAITTDDMRDLLDQISKEKTLNVGIQSDLNNIRFFSESIKKDQDDLTKFQSQYSTLLSTLGPEVPTLPEDYNDQVNYWNQKYNFWIQYKKDQDELNSKKLELESHVEDLRKARDLMNSYMRYMKITSTTGDIYEQIMEKFAKEFSDNNFRYVVNPYKFRNKDYLDLDVQFNVRGRWVSYQSLSSGQQTLCDINFLSKITTVNGLLVMDEMLKHLDPENTSYCTEVLSRMNVHCILISTHSDDINFYNKRLLLNLDSSGTTSIDIQ
jgi:DNA repair exonuclease SbcCD ATPase subunit